LKFNDKFQSNITLSFFWVSIEDDYPLLSQKATKTLLPFAIMYICARQHCQILSI